MHCSRGRAVFGASKQTRSRARARPLTRYARPLSARHHVPWRAGAQVRHRARLLRRRQGVRARVRMRVRVLVPPHPFQSALATVATHHLKRLASDLERRWGEARETTGGDDSSDGVLLAAAGTRRKPPRPAGSWLPPAKWLAQINKRPLDGCAKLILAG